LNLHDFYFCNLTLHVALGTWQLSLHGWAFTNGAIVVKVVVVGEVVIDNHYNAFKSLLKGLSLVLVIEWQLSVFIWDMQVINPQVH
jgi:hypothetical protein